MEYSIHSFGNIVDAVYQLTLVEREELHLLLQKNIVEARRDEIYQNGLQAKKDNKAGKLKFSSKVKDLKKML